MFSNVFPWFSHVFPMFSHKNCHICSISSGYAPSPRLTVFIKARRRFCAWWSCTSAWARPGDHHITIIYIRIYIYTIHTYGDDILMTMVIWCDMMTGSSLLWPLWCIYIYICMYVHIYILMTMVKWWQYNIININYCIFQRSLEVKLPTIRTYGKAEVGRVREEKRRREKIREEKAPEERTCRCGKR